MTTRGENRNNPE